jgi:DGQHR domain-containing protein
MPTVRKKAAVKKAATKRFLELPCLEFQQGNKTLVGFSANAKLMWNVLSINRKIEDKDEGYQRSLSGSRVKSIAKYIDSGNTIPQSLLITLDDAELIQKAGKTFIRIKNHRDAGWVIDGQHRFAGAYTARKDINLPFVAFIGLEIEEQIQLFININQLAKGVPSSLYLDLLRNLPNKTPQEQAKERAADLGGELKKDEDSPFYAKIVITTSPKKGEISLTNFVRKVTPLIQPGKGILNAFTEAEQRGIIANYFTALKNIFPKEFNRIDSIFFQTLGFGALMNALPTFFSICLRVHAGFAVEDATKVFKKIDYFDFSTWHSKGTGSAAEIEAGNDLSTELNAMFEISANGTASIRI